MEHNFKIGDKLLHKSGEVGHFQEYSTSLDKTGVRFVRMRIEDGIYFQAPMMEFAPYSKLDDMIEELFARVEKIENGITTKCDVCGRDFEMALMNHYIARDTSENTGLSSFVCGGAEELLYDAFDCPYCGCQTIKQERKRVFIPYKEDISEAEEET